MFTFQAATAASPRPKIASGMKRAASQSSIDQSLKQMKHQEAVSPATIAASAAQAAQENDLYCFQLLQVRGIPDWANR